MKTKGKSPGKPASSRAVAPVRSRPIHMRQILVPVDFSASSRKALEYAVSFAAQFGAKVILLHVVEPPMYPTELGYVPVEVESLNRAIRSSAEQKIEEWSKQHVEPGMLSKALVRMGHPYQEITRASGGLRPDLIVISTHGYTGLKHVVLGSTAERIVRHAKCPVLVVREQEHDFV